MWLLQIIKKKFNKDAKFKQAYSYFMHKYEELGYMLQTSSLSSINSWTCYLLYHEIYKKSSTTTKLRVVFNGSHRLVLAALLNEHLLMELDLVSTLPDILIRWLQHRYIITADIEKMYRQIRTRLTEICKE